MKRIFLAGLIMIAFLCAGEILAYEVKTHEDISSNALDASVLKLDPSVLVNLGLKPLSDEQVFPNFSFLMGAGTISQLVRHGAEQEDDLRGSRFVHHFYNPLNGDPLTDITSNGLLATILVYGQPVVPLETSPDWALQDGTVRSVGQDFSFNDARRYFFEALSGTGFLGARAVGRSERFGLMFQSLGHVMHHIQDMAQPQHVKNEAHPVLKTPATHEVFYAPGGLYEHYTDEGPVRGALPFAGYEPVFSPESGKDHTTFNTARKFWVTNETGPNQGNGLGLAEFTTRNFVTYGHNFTGSLEHIEPDPTFPNPNAAGATITVINAPLLPNIAPELGPLNGKMYFIGTPVIDSYRSGESGFNNLASTYSIYDDDLKNFHLHIRCFPNAAGGFPTDCNQEAVFSVNRFTMGTAHQFLIKRAVGYSAGLINYFFRGVGKIDLVSNTQDPSGYVIENNSEETMTGTFYLYYDDQEDTRWLHQTWPATGGIDAHGKKAVPGFAPPTDPNRLPKTPGQYLLVFKGQMGFEGENPSIPNANFAVAANVVNLGAGGLIVTSGGDARGFAVPGNGGAVTIETGASLTTAPPAAQALNINAADTMTLSSGIVHYSSITIKGTLELSGDVTLSSDGPVVVSGIIETRSTTNPQDGANLAIEAAGPIIVSGRIDTSGHNADLVGQGDQEGSQGGNVTIRTTSSNTFVVPTIITRGGDAAFIYPRDPVQQNWTGGHGGDITITTQGTTPGVALQFGGERLLDSAVDPLPQQQGVHELPTQTTFHRGLLTTGGYGGQFGGLDGINEAGAPGGNGGSITVTCQQPAQVQFAETDLFTGGNIDILLKYETAVVFAKGERPRFPILVQRTGSMGGRGSYGGTVINGGDGGPGGTAGAIDMSSTCTLTPAPATFTDPPHSAPLFDGVDPRGGISSRLPIIAAFDIAGTRLYTLQAFGGGGGIPGGSAFTLARCSSDDSACSVEDGANACPLLPNGSTQLCIPVPGIEPSPGNYGPRGADGPVSCLTLGLTPPTPPEEGLICQ